MLLTAGLSAQTNFFHEPFDDNKNNWPFLGNHDGYSLAIQNGHLRVESTSNVIVRTFINPKVDKIDYGLSVEMFLEKGNADGLIGLCFGMSEDGKDYYSFMYDNTGFYGVYKNGEEMKLLFGGKEEGLVKRFEYNDLLVVKDGNEYSFELNHKQIYTTKIDNTFGDFIAIKTSAETTVKVNELNIYNHKRAMELSKNGLDNLFDGLVFPKKKGGN